MTIETRKRKAVSEAARADPPHPKRTKASSSAGERTEAKGEVLEKEPQEYTQEQCHWIRLHFYLLNHAVTNRDDPVCTAPKGTVSCAYFNAYYQGFCFVPKGRNVPIPDYPWRMFKDFDAQRRRLLPDTINQINQRSMDNERKPHTREFRPVIEPQMLSEFIDIFEKHSESGEFDWEDDDGAEKLRGLLDTIIDQQLAPSQPTWLADGERNILSRPPLSLAGYTAHHTGELQQSVSGRRMHWHQDYYTEMGPRDFLQVSRSEKGVKERIPMNYRKVHADVGNALLNMAIIPPQGYDGDLRALVDDTKAVNLPEMTEGQRKQFDDHIAAVKAGDALRNRIFGEAVWPPAAEATDTAARVLSVRMLDADSDDS